MKTGKINSISIVKNAYVSDLQHIPSPLLHIYAIGALPAKRRPTVAIIGSRRPTKYGEEITRQFTSYLAKKGVIIISGLAYGIDAIAHKAALDAGGTTIAVLANGLHTIYPAAHEGLAKQIVQQSGALISEAPPGHEVRPWDFLARNRIISGIADAVLVPEATERSGTLSTVEHAIAQGKQVFAAPGPITSALSAGSNKILQQGAHVTLRPEDILEIIAPELIQPVKGSTQEKLPLGDTPLEAEILTLLRSGVSAREDIMNELVAADEEILQAMTLLELKGDIYAVGGDRWAVRAP